MTLLPPFDRIFLADCVVFYVKSESLNLDLKKKNKRSIDKSVLSCTLHCSLLRVL